MKEPLVTVIIPTYNRAATILRSINSVLSQTYNNLELLVVDDCSTDQTAEIVKAIDDKRLHYLKTVKNSGANIARNLGLRRARGEFIAFQDSDDVWLEDKLAKQLGHFKKFGQEVGVVYSGYAKVGKNSRRNFAIKKMAEKINGYIHHQILSDNLARMATAVIRSQCFKQIGLFNEKMPRLQEWELFLRISKYYQFQCLDQALVDVYYTPGCISENHLAFVQAYKIILEEFASGFLRNSGKFAHYCGWSAVILLKNGQLTEARKFLRKSLKLHFSIKYLFFYFLSFAGKGPIRRISALRS